MELGAVALMLLSIVKDERAKVNTVVKTYSLAFSFLSCVLHWCYLTDPLEPANAHYLQSLKMG